MSQKSIQNELEYTKHVVSERLCYYEPHKNKLQKTFVQELSSSLNQKQKSINPKFFYDKKGSKLFEEIYLEQKKRIYNALKNADADSVVKFKNILKKIINE